MPDQPALRRLSLVAKASSVGTGDVVDVPAWMIFVFVGIVVVSAMFMLLWRTLDGSRLSGETMPLKSSRAKLGCGGGLSSSHGSAQPSRTPSAGHAAGVADHVRSGRQKAGRRMSEMCRGRSLRSEIDTTVVACGSEVAASSGRLPRPGSQRAASQRSLAASAGPGSQRQLPPPAAGMQVFTVSLETLVLNSEWGSFGLSDAASGTELRVAMVKGPNGCRCLRIFGGQGAQEPSMELRPMQMGGVPGDPAEGNLEISGPGGEVLGALNLQPNGAFSVSAKGKPQLLIEGSESSELDLRISQPGGKTVGTVSCNDGTDGEVATVEFLIMPGADSMLIVGCVMAVLLMCFDDDDQ